MTKKEVQVATRLTTTTAAAATQAATKTTAVAIVTILTTATTTTAIDQTNTIDINKFNWNVSVHVKTISIYKLIYLPWHIFERWFINRKLKQYF